MPPSKKPLINNNERDRALEKLEKEESIMTKEELTLRDSVNKELSRSGFHLRLALLQVKENESIHNFVEPVNNWIDEIPKADSLTVKRIKEWQKEKLQHRTEN